MVINSELFFGIRILNSLRCHQFQSSYFCVRKLSSRHLFFFYHVKLVVNEIMDALFPAIKSNRFPLFPLK